VCAGDGVRWKRGRREVAQNDADVASCVDRCSTGGLTLAAKCSTLAAVVSTGCCSLVSHSPTARTLGVCANDERACTAFVRQRWCAPKKRRRGGE
jgi:hypothetical protein